MKIVKLRVFVCAVAATLFLFSFSLLFAGGMIENSKAPDFDITLPESGMAGDAAVAVFRTNEPLNSATVSLKNNDGTVVASAQAFFFSENSVQRKLLIRYTYAAVIAFPVTLESGSYLFDYMISLESGREIAGSSEVSVTAPEWASEDIHLDERNTSIITNTGEERIAQIDKLNEILFSFDRDAPRFASGFIRPVASRRVTSGFGDRRVFIYSSDERSSSIHYGIDFGVPTGTPVAAAGDGIVVMAEERISTGYSVVIEHMPGVFSLYYHLDELSCNEGDKVSVGDIIGKSGATGLATGPHLHWEFRVNGEAISPEFFLKDEFAALYVVNEK